MFSGQTLFAGFNLLHIFNYFFRVSCFATILLIESNPAYIYQCDIVWLNQVLVKIRKWASGKVPLCPTSGKEQLASALVEWHN